MATIGYWSTFEKMVLLPLPTLPRHWVGGQAIIQYPPTDTSTQNDYKYDKTTEMTTLKTTMKKTIMSINGYIIFMSRYWVLGGDVIVKE